MWMQIAMLLILLVGSIIGFAGGRASKRQAIFVERPLVRVCERHTQRLQRENEQ